MKVETVDSPRIISVRAAMDAFSVDEYEPRGYFTIHRLCTNPVMVDIEMMTDDGPCKVSVLLTALRRAMQCIEVECERL